jgi:hypothetical protein
VLYYMYRFAYIERDGLLYLNSNSLEFVSTHVHFPSNHLIRDLLILVSPLSHARL